MRRGGVNPPCPPFCKGGDESPPFAKGAARSAGGFLAGAVPLSGVPAEFSTNQKGDLYPAERRGGRWIKNAL